MQESKRELTRQAAELQRELRAERQMASASESAMVNANTSADALEGDVAMLLRELRARTERADALAAENGVLRSRIYARARTREESG